MLRDLSLHVLDITNNSLRAGATRIVIDLQINTLQNSLTLIIKDNGAGISEEKLATILSPFSTSRTTRRFGLGLPFFNEACQLADGSLRINSQLHVGTSVIATMAYQHIDRPPLGNLPLSLATIAASDNLLELKVHYGKDSYRDELSTAEVKAVLGELPLALPEVQIWLKQAYYELLNGEPLV